MQVNPTGNKFIQVIHVPLQEDPVRSEPVTSGYDIRLTLMSLHQSDPIVPEHSVK